MDNTGFISLWVGQALPRHAKLCIKSHLDHGFSFTLFVYPHMFTDYQGVPSGCVIADANDVVDRSEIFKNKAWNSWAPFSDMWRYAYLARYGGNWCDLDFICLKEWTPGEYYFYGQDGACNISLLTVPKGLPLIVDLYQTWKHPNNLEEQPEWIKKNLARYYMGDASLPINEQRARKYYGWAGYQWTKPGIAYYNLQDKIGPAYAKRYWQSKHNRVWFDGSVQLDDERLKDEFELELNAALVTPSHWNNMTADSVVAKLWNKHFGNG